MATSPPISGTHSPWQYSTVPVSFVSFHLIMETLNSPPLSQKKGDFSTIRCSEGNILRNHIHMSFTMVHYWGSSFQLLLLLFFFTESSLHAKNMYVYIRQNITFIKFCISYSFRYSLKTWNPTLADKTRLQYL